MPEQLRPESKDLGEAATYIPNSSFLIFPRTLTLITFLHHIRRRFLIGEFIEERELAGEEELHCIDRAVTVLGEDDFRLILLRIVILHVTVVVRGTEEEGDHVRILLQRAGFSQVRQERAMVLTGLDAS